MKNNLKFTYKDIIGFILITPSIISVFLYLILLFNGNGYNGLNIFATVETYSSSGNGGYTTSLPLYYGLMAIAGAYLIKDQNFSKNQFEKEN